MIIRLMQENDCARYKALFDEAYSEYLQSLKKKNPQQYRKEKQEKREVTRSRFYFYMRTGSSFVAEEGGRVVGYVASQTVPFMHGFDKLLWIEYVVVQRSLRRRGIGTALLRRLLDHARSSKVDRIYTTINPDNVASIGLHSKAGFNVEIRNIASYRVSQQ